MLGHKTTYMYILPQFYPNSINILWYGAPPQPRPWCDSQYFKGSAVVSGKFNSLGRLISEETLVGLHIELAIVSYVNLA